MYSTTELIWAFCMCLALFIISAKVLYRLIMEEEDIIRSDYISETGIKPRTKEFHKRLVSWRICLFLFCSVLVLIMGGCIYALYGT